MYRKYQLKRTHVINPHNYLLEAHPTNANTPTPCLFHQILISSQSLPSLKDAPAIQQIIGQTENQNSVNELPAGFEFYLEKNLLQIRLKEGIRPITDITSLPIRQSLTLLNTLNVDFAISVKQMRSMAKHNQSTYSNSNKFFSMMAMRERRGELILPLIDGEQIHFYDVYYQEAFCNNREKEKEKVDRKDQDLSLKKRVSQKKIKRKSQMSEDIFYTDEVAFRRYLLFLTSLFFHENIVQFLQDLQKIGELTTTQSLKRLERMGNEARDKTQRMLLELLYRCISCDTEYSLNIFIKQCEILIDKHDKLLQQTIPSQKRIQDSRPIRQDKLKTSKSCLALNKDLRAELSFSHHDRPATRESQKRLKGAKSLINLKGNKAIPAPKGRSLKNGSIFSKSKEKLNDKTNLFQQSLSSLNKEKVKIPFYGGVSMGSSATSNWFNQSTLPNESLIKLRNFKKGNNFTNTASHTPAYNQLRNSLPSANSANIMQENEVSKQIERVSESQLSRLGRIIRKQSVKAEKPIELDDKFTMTEQIQENIHQAKEEQMIESKEERKTAIQETVELRGSIKEPKSNKCFKREIVNTLNLKFGEQPNKKVEMKVQIGKKQEVKQEISQQIPIEEPKATPKITKNSQIIKKEPTPRKETQNTKPMQRKQSVQGIKKDMIKPKRVEAVKQPILDDEQFEQVTLTKKQAPRVIQKPTQSMTKSTIIQQKQKQPKNPKLPNQIKNPPPLLPKTQKWTLKALPQDQKKHYTDHFAHLLKFYNSNIPKIRTLPQTDSLVYIIYHIYYRTILENFNNPIQSYKQIINILTKKQQRMSADKDVCQLFTVAPQTLLEKGNTIRAIEESLNKGIEQSILRERIAQSRPIIQQIYKLTCQANRLLQMAFQEMFTSALKGKSMLINQDKLLVALQWAYYTTFTMIISLQREHYYACMLRYEFGKMAECFPFRFSKGVNEHYSEYSKRLQGLDGHQITNFDVRQEFSYFKGQYERYK